MSRKLTIIIGAILVASAIMTPTQAFASFSAKEAKENSVKIESTASPAIEFKVETLEVLCNKVKGEGSVVELPGITSGEAKGDLPALTSVLDSDRLGFKPKFESCEETLGSEKGEANVNAETCQLEMFQEQLTAAASLSFRAAKAEKACTLKLEQPKTKCLVEISGSLVSENEGLESLKLKNITTFESKIESGSEVKSINTTTSNCSGIAAKPVGSMRIEKNLLIKGAELTNPSLLMLETKGIIPFLPEPNAFETREAVVTITAANNFTEISTINVLNRYPALTNSFKVKAGANNCTGKILVAGGKCTFALEFTPEIEKQSYLGDSSVSWALNGTKMPAFGDTLAGKSK